MAALGAGIFIWPRTADHAAASTSGAAPSAVTNLPTPVHTVSIRESDKTGGDLSLSMLDKDPARAPQVAPIVSGAVGAGAETAPAQSAAAADLAASPLKLWAMMPADTSPPGWTPAGQQAMDQAVPVEKPAAPAPEHATPPHKTATAQHGRHVVHRQRKWHRRHRVATSSRRLRPRRRPNSRRKRSGSTAADQEVAAASRDRSHLQQRRRCRQWRCAGDDAVSCSSGRGMSGSTTGSAARARSA